MRRPQRSWYALKPQKRLRCGANFSDDYYKFNAESQVDEILKIGQHFGEVNSKVEWHCLNQSDHQQFVLFLRSPVC